MIVKFRLLLLIGVTSAQNRLFNKEQTAECSPFAFEYDVDNAGQLTGKKVHINEIVLPVTYCMVFDILLTAGGAKLKET